MSESKLYPIESHCGSLRKEQAKSNELLTALKQHGHFDLRNLPKGTFEFQQSFDSACKDSQNTFLLSGVRSEPFELVSSIEPVSRRSRSLQTVSSCRLLEYDKSFDRLQSSSDESINEIKLSPNATNMTENQEFRNNGEDGMFSADFGFNTEPAVAFPVPGNTDSLLKLSTWKRIIVNYFHRIGQGILSYFQTKPKDADGGEVETVILRYMPESMERLLSLTNFDRTELKTLYRHFKNECPTGVAQEDVFKQIYSQFFPNGDTDMYAHYLFLAFDRGDEGHINFEEFVVGLSALLRGSFTDRIRWTFRLYDINHDGYITREEMHDIVKSVYMLLGKCVDPPLCDEDYIEHSERIFTKLDRNGDGLITIDEFCETCGRDQNIVESMAIFDHAF